MLPGQERGCRNTETAISLITATAHSCVRSPLTKHNLVMLKGKKNIHKHPNMPRCCKAAQVTGLGTCPASSFIGKYARSPHAPTQKKGGRSLKQTIPSLMSRRSICSDYCLGPWISLFGYITISLYSRASVFKRNQNQSGKKGNSWPFSQDLPLE